MAGSKPYSSFGRYLNDLKKQNDKVKKRRANNPALKMSERNIGTAHGAGYYQENLSGRGGDMEDRQDRRDYIYNRDEYNRKVTDTVVNNVMKDALRRSRAKRK